MRVFLVLFVGSALAGCTTLFLQIPSVQNCQQVMYVRDHSQVQITADCDLSRDGLTGE